MPCLSNHAGVDRTTLSLQDELDSGQLAMSFALGQSCDKTRGDRIFSLSEASAEIDVIGSYKRPRRVGDSWAV